MVKKEKSSVKKNEAHLLKAVGKNVVTEKSVNLCLITAFLFSYPFAIFLSANIRLCWG